MSRSPHLAALLVLSTLGGLAVPDTAWAFRCGNRLVAEGDTRGEVRARCGAPTEVTRSSLLRPAIVWRHGRPYQVGHAPVEVPVEVWIYNLGPSRLMRKLRFEDGQLVEIDALGYGYR